MQRFRKHRVYAVYDRGRAHLVLGWVRLIDGTRWAVAEPVHGMAKGRERYATRREAAESLVDD